MRFSVRPNIADQAKSPLTSFVDIVFLLLIFFVLTFRVAPVEGDFAVTMQSDSIAGFGDPEVRVSIRPDKQLRDKIEIQWRSYVDAPMNVRDMRQLNEFAWRHLQREQPDLPYQGGDAVAVLEIAPELEYRHTLDAVAALSARRDGEQRTVLFRNISFAKQQIRSR